MEQKVGVAKSLHPMNGMRNLNISYKYRYFVLKQIYLKILVWINLLF